MIDEYRLKKDAAQFRERNGLNNTEPIRLNSLLMKLGVVTVFKQLNDNFSGIALKAGEHRFMIVNSKHGKGRQHFTICHELYHLFIQEDFKSMVCNTGRFDKKDKIEYAADSFAAFFFMPEDGILSLIPDEELKTRISLGTIVKIEQFFSCSRTALLFRLLNMDLIDKAKYELWRNNVKQTASLFGYTDALYSPGNDNLVIGDYGERAKKLFDGEKISESNYVSLMHDIGIDVDGEFAQSLQNEKC